TLSTALYTLSLHDALPILRDCCLASGIPARSRRTFLSRPSHQAHHTCPCSPCLGAECVEYLPQPIAQLAVSPRNFTCCLCEQRSIRFDSCPLDSLGRTRHRAL